MLAQMGAYEDAVDRVLYMHSYYAGSLEEWLEYLRPVLDEHTLPRSKLGAGLAIFHDARTAGWADTAEAAKERLCWLSNQSVPEVALFRILHDADHEWPDPFWIDPLHAYASGSACDPGPAPTGHCPPEWMGPNQDGCCVRSSSPACREDCAKDECTHYKEGWWWKPEDYHHHPYTCCPPNKTGIPAAAPASPLPLQKRRCAGRENWMEGECVGIKLGASTPETRANDARNGSLAIGANLFEVQVPPETPYFSISLRVVKGRCVGKWFTRRSASEPPFSAKVNRTSAAGATELTNVAGSGGAPTVVMSADGGALWTIVVYLPFQDETPTGRACSFILSVDALAPPLALSTAPHELKLHPAGLPIVFTWNETIAQPVTIRASRSGTPSTNLNGNAYDNVCNVVLSVRGTADMFGGVAQWDGDVAPTTRDTGDLFAPLIGFAGGTWAMSVQLERRTAQTSCNVSFWLHKLPVLAIANATASAMTRATLSAGERPFLSLAHRTPPHSYAALDMATLAGTCKGVTVSWIADRFQDRRWALRPRGGRANRPHAMWPSSFDPSVGASSARPIPHQACERGRGQLHGRPARGKRATTLGVS